MRVRGSGPTDASWMIIGEGPGPREAEVGEPFVGKTGEELRRYFDGDSLPPFKDTFRTNVYREFGGPDYEYTPEDLARDEPELLEELARVQPQIIVAVGRYAARYLLGDISLDETHGLAWGAAICYDCGKVSSQSNQTAKWMLGLERKEHRQERRTSKRSLEGSNSSRSSSFVRNSQGIDTERSNTGTSLQPQVVSKSRSHGSHDTTGEHAKIQRASYCVSERTSVEGHIHRKQNTLVGNQPGKELSNLQTDSKSRILGSQRLCASCGSKKTSDTVVFVCYHPAAGFRSPEASALVSYDFQQLAVFAAGDLTPRILHDDPFPDPQYFHVTNVKTIETFRNLHYPELGVDSEGWARHPWSLQWSRHPGTGYLCRTREEDYPILDAFFRMVVEQGTVLAYHNALHDRSVLRAIARLCGWGEKDILFKLDQIPFRDTMVMAYLLQLEPQGLKGLATRHANMSMQSYDELMGETQNGLAREWLYQAWDCLNFEYEEEQRREFEIINKTPLLDKDGKPKRSKDGQVKYRRTTVLPKIPKQDVFKAVERTMRSKTPFVLWGKQNEDVLDAGYRAFGSVPEATLSHVGFPEALRYGCRDSDAEVRVLPEMESRIDAMGLRGVYDLEISTYPLIDRMMQIGMKPDLKIFAALSEKLSYEIADLQVRLEKATGVYEFNANSHLQVGKYLYDTIGLEPLKFTSEGEPSTNDKLLETHEKEDGWKYPAISDIRSYRELYKLKATFCDRIPDYVNRYPNDGRVHCTLRTTRVITGRLAAADPNLLAQPEHGKFAKDFKAGWVAEDGHVLCGWDLSQVELRILAHLSKDPVLMAAYLFKCRHEKDWQSGKTMCKRDECVMVGDLHAKLAHQVFGVKPSQQDDSKHRIASKRTNFGLAMGMTCHGLMIELRKNGVEVDEDGAQEWIDATNKLYARVPKYKIEKISEARRNGYVRCLSGRIRYIGGIRSRDERLRAEAERFAFSTPIQEGAQRSMKEAEAHIYKEILLKKYWKQGYYKGGPRKGYVEPLLQVHDAIKGEVLIGLERDLHTEVCYAMTKVPTQLSVPLGVEGKYGPNFKDMQKF